MSKPSLSNPPALQPCPFCGGPAKLFERHGEGYSVYGRFWYSVGCSKCAYQFDDREVWSEDFTLTLPPMECVGRWNKRAGHDDGPARVRETIDER